MAIYVTAPYETLATDGPFELRRYGAFTSAAVDSQAWEGGDGFSRIFNYISGANETGQKISMTTPVLNELTQNAATTEFVMPAAFTPDTLPRPNDPSIRIRSWDQRLTVVIRFSGNARADRVAQMEARLSDWIRHRGLQIIGAPRLARYNPPFIPPFLRRNELLLDVTKPETKTMP